MTRHWTTPALRRRFELPARLQRRARLQGDLVALAVLEGGPRWRPVDTDTAYEIRIVGYLAGRGLRAS